MVLVEVSGDGDSLGVRVASSRGCLPVWVTLSKVLRPLPLSDWPVTASMPVISSAPMTNTAAVASSDRLPAHPAPQRGVRLLGLVVEADHVGLGALGLVGDAAAGRRGARRIPVVGRISRVATTTCRVRASEAV